MGCVSSKHVVKSSPPFEYSSNADESSRGILDGSLFNKVNVERTESIESTKASSNRTSTTSARLGNLYRYIEGEQTAAGWPTWLSSVAREAVHGMVPLKSESFERLEKVGQGTYSTVFKARELETGKLFALKKVRFDNFDPESVRFMAREIMILRRLNHPNVIKLEGIITARLSCSLYLVFEYMEHDLAGLSSAPDIKFSESQVKCYMHQLLSGLDHCHSHGIMHRDIKCANLLVNNEGILKMADFGLANFSDRPPHNQPLTSRVVTLWYRPPELLLGSTDYEASIDLWSIGCVFAELFIGKPILQGRTEVEQIHKIFKLCGSPPDEYWKKSKLPHAAVFKPHQPYVNCLRKTFNYLPESTFRLLQTFLALEPNKRGTAASALSSEYFKTKPYACEPSNLPRYSPHKEMDVKYHEETHRRRASRRHRGSEVSNKPSRMHRRVQSINPQKLTTNEEEPWQNSSRRLLIDLDPEPTINNQDEEHTSKHELEKGYPFSGPLTSSFSTNGTHWQRKPRLKNNTIQEDKNVESKEPGEMEKKSNRWVQPDLGHPNNTNNHHRDLPKEHYRRDTVSSKHHRVISDFQGHSQRTDLSGHFLSQPNKVDELLEKHERHMRQAVRSMNHGHEKIRKTRIMITDSSSPCKYVHMFILHPKYKTSSYVNPITRCRTMMTSSSVNSGSLSSNVNLVH